MILVLTGNKVELHKSKRLSNLITERKRTENNKYCYMWYKGARDVLVCGINSRASADKEIHQTKKQSGFSKG